MYAYCNNNPVNFSDPTGMTYQDALNYQKWTPFPRWTGHTPDYSLPGIYYSDYKQWEKAYNAWFAGYWVAYNKSKYAPLASWSYYPSRNGFKAKDREEHKGIDMLAEKGTPIYAVEGGTAIAYREGQFGGYGNCVVITWDNGKTHIYGHMDDVAIPYGIPVSVEKHQLIGYVGSTGRSTANHLHFEARVNDAPVDPWPYFLHYYYP